MFGFGKRRDKNKKKSRLDKLLMGAIVGGAVGSVIGMSIAPKSGKETREFLAQKGKDLLEKGKEVSDKLQKKKGLFSKMKDRLLGRKPKQNLAVHEEDRFRRIPTER